MSSRRNVSVLIVLVGQDEVAQAEVAQVTHPPVIGDYVLGAELGRGGMGVVYEAAHRVTGERVALKTLAELTPSAKQRFQSEIYALRSLHHPAIVPLLAHGTQDERPWFAMRLIRAETLRQWHARLWSSQDRRSSPSAETCTGDDLIPISTRPPPRPRFRPQAAAGHLRECLLLAQRLCAPLAYIHGEGIVHCDLKPKNVFVLPTTELLLTDFGIATRFTRAFDREALTCQRPGAGTLAYMAPEQRRLASVDARCDLYALGCTLYELLVGWPPAELATDTTDRPFEPPSSFVTGVPLELDELLEQLLAVDPSERPRYAEDVGYRLARLTGEPFEPRAPRPKAYVYPPRHIGHGTQVESLLARISTCAQGEGGLVIVTGSSGSGKSRLLRELALRADIPWVNGQRLLADEASQAQPLEQRTPLGAFRHVLDFAVRGARATSGTSMKLPGAAALARLEPALTPWADPIEQPGITRDLGTFEVFYHALDSLLRQLARERGLVVVLDDLHCVDAQSLAFIEYFSRQPRLGRPLLLAACRPEECPEPLTRLLLTPGVDQVALPRLDRPAVDDFVSSLLAQLPPPALMARVNAEAEGNPSRIAHCVGVALAQGSLVRRAGQWHERDRKERLPAWPLGSDECHELTRRWATLPAAPLGVLQAAAAFGGDCRITVLQAVSGLDEHLFHAALDELCGLELLRKHEQDVTVSRNAVAELCYSQIPAQVRADLHCRIAQSLEAWLDAPWSASASAELARHWALAGFVARASGVLQRAQTE